MDRLEYIYEYDYSGTPGSSFYTREDSDTIDGIRKTRAIRNRVRRRAAAIACLILISLTFVVGVIVLVMTTIEQQIAYGSWSEWSPWSACNQTCGAGHRTRDRTCDLPVLSDVPEMYCRGQEGDIETCNGTTCAGPHVAPPPIPEFNSTGIDVGENATVYLCSDVTKSIDVASGTQECPRITYKNETWTSFNATCGKSRTFGNEIQGVGGSVFAEFGNLTSPNFPDKFPDEYAVYQWTLVSTGTSINFRFDDIDLPMMRDDCLGSTSVTVYCGMNIPPRQPSLGPFCGGGVPANVTCPSECAIVRFAVIPTGEDYRGFNIHWSSA